MSDRLLRGLWVLCLIFCITPAVAEALEVSATAAVLMDADMGQVLYEKNGDRQMLIASTTKIMTALVVLEHAAPDDVITVTPNHMAEGSSMYLRAGETVRVEELLYGLLLCSGNDAALALTECAGGLTPFVALMNEKAAALGMAHTSFANPNGLDADGHYSTARDMAGRRGGGKPHVPAHLLQPQCHHRPAHHGEPQPPPASGGRLRRPENGVHPGGGPHTGILYGAGRLPSGGGDAAGRQRLGRPRRPV